MDNPAMPNLPGFGAIAESMELGRKLWGNTGWAATGISGMAAPGLSAEEIDKQIADLKAVEGWLTLNMNMLRGTIQALEVQSATISALKSMGEAFKNAGSGAAAPATGFSFPFAAPGQAKPATTAAHPAQASTAVPPAGDTVAPSMADPAAWWNLLQSQFKQAVNAATTPHGSAATPESSGDTPDAAANQEVPDRSERPAFDAQASDAGAQASPISSKRATKDAVKPPTR